MGAVVSSFFEILLKAVALFAVFYNNVSDEILLS